MKYEQRFLLAISITAGILLLWSIWAPQPPIQTSPSPAGQTQKTELVAPLSPREETQEFLFGPHHLKIGVNSGGIHSWNAKGSPILESAIPGFMEMRSLPADQSVSLSSTQEKNRLISRGRMGDDIQLQRELELKTEPTEHLLLGRLSLENLSSERKEAALRVVFYKPLFEEQAANHRQFASGTAWIGGKPKNLKVKLGQSVRFSGESQWVVAQSHFSALIVQPESLPGMFHVEHPVGGEETGWLELRTLLQPKEKKSFTFRIYAGPAILSEVKKAGMEEALFFGIFSDITCLLLRFLNWSYHRLHSYGWAICLLSVAVWLPFSPLTFYGMKISQGTMKKMAALKPQESRIRKEHANNPQKMQQELMELYRKHKVNPASGCIGCLPLLLTWPVYFALFQVFNRAPELQGASFFWIRDLSAPDALIRFPAALPVLGMGLNILPLVSTALYFVQQKFMQPPVVGELTEEQKAQQQMMKFMPLVLLFVFYNMPAGFMLYWVINSGLMAGQQTLLARSAAPANT